MQSTDRAPQVNRDLTLSPNSYLYLQSETKQGSIVVHRGPSIVNQTGNDVPIKYDPNSGKFSPCDDLTQAVKQCPMAAEGDYVIITNPTEGNAFPKTQGAQAAIELQRGCKVVIPGPWSEALYPGQSATVIPGHRLRSNQFLVAMVYEAKKAEDGWTKDTVVEDAADPLIDAESSESTGQQRETPSPQQESLTTEGKGLPTPESFAVGTRIVIRGTQVSFFIPCTGVETIKDDDDNYVREAVTLEQMEYCELIGESGSKEFPKGPKVVFPSPTQIFGTDSRKRRKFRPTELNTINGIHLKVTADFTDEDLEQPAGSDGKRPDRKYQEGEELFVTGNTLAIYYPREELAIIEYGQGNKKHYSTAIPKGEGRYVIDRESGKIRVEKGPAMFLANPRLEIPVRRILDQVTCSRWYPNNDEALQYNAELAEAMASSPSGRSGLVSEGDVRKFRAKQIRSSTKGSPSASYLQASDAIGANEMLGDFTPEEVGTEGGKTIGRGQAYTEPRTLTLNTKYDGVPRIEVWPGYAVLIVGSQSNERRVVEGPSVELLEYDEKLGYVTLSTGKPKNTDNLYATPYLCVQNNQVGDIINFESADHVRGTIKISMRVTFEGETQDDKLRWFSTENYVKFLCDHVRSIIGGMAKRNSVAEIKGNYIDLVRDAVLGPKERITEPRRPTDFGQDMENEGGPALSTLLGEDRRTTRSGLFFPDNGMRVIEVEVLELDLKDAEISEMLNEAELEVVRSNIRIQQAEKDLEATTKLERIAQHKLVAEHDTSSKEAELEVQTIEEQLAVTLAQIEAGLKKLEEDAKTQAARDGITDASEEAKRARLKADTDQQLTVDTANQKLSTELITVETDAATKRMAAAKDGLSETLVALGRDDMAARLAEALNIERFLTGDSLGSSVTNLLSFFPSLKDLLDRGDKAQADRTNRLRNPAEAPS